MQFAAQLVSSYESTPGGVPGVFSVCVRRCPTFPPGVGSIIGAGWLSFRVRDGSGRFPAAMAAVTLCIFFWVFRCFVGVLVGGVVWIVGVWLRVCW